MAWCRDLFWIWNDDSIRKIATLLSLPVIARRLGYYEDDSVARCRSRRVHAASSVTPFGFGTTFLSVIIAKI